MLEYQKFEIGQRITHQYYGAGEIITFIMSGDVRSYMIKLGRHGSLLKSLKVHSVHVFWLKCENNKAKSKNVKINWQFQGNT